MNAQRTMDIEELGKASRRAALVSLVGFLLVVAAMVYATLELRALDQAREAARADVVALQREVATLQNTEARYTSEIAKLNGDLSKARGALSAARDAIRAFHEGDRNLAVELYDKALAYDPDNAYLQNLRAYALFKLGRFTEAIQSEQLSIRADPKKTYPYAYFDLARFLCAAGKFDEARVAAKQAVDLGFAGLMKSDGEFQRVCKNQFP
jgi:tetratricopeptide (TPR) repeat protein